MKVKATHYINIKEQVTVPGEGDLPAKTRPGKDLFIMRSGTVKEVTKKEMELLEKEAAGKFKVVEEKQDGEN